MIKDDEVYGVTLGEHVHDENFDIINSFGVCERAKHKTRRMELLKYTPLAALLHAEA